MPAVNPRAIQIGYARHYNVLRGSRGQDAQHLCFGRVWKFAGLPLSRFRIVVGKENRDRNREME